MIKSNPAGIYLKGISQIMLQENTLTGFLFIIGIFLGSWLMGVAALVSVITGTVTAFLLRYPKENIERGLYGFSAALTGVALIFFFKPTIIVGVCLIIGSMAATMLQHYFIKTNLPVFTLPFVLVTWVLFFYLSKWYPEYRNANIVTEVSEVENFFFVIKGFGQVIFQAAILSGAIFLVAVFISSPAAALYGLAGAAISAVIAMIFYLPAQEINKGLFSYNAVLSAIVFAENKFRIRNMITSLAAIILTAAISIIMYKSQMLQLTFPFVAASFSVVLLNRIISRHF